MKQLLTVISIFLLFLFSGRNISFAYHEQNLFVITGRDAAVREGDNFNRSVFFIEVPKDPGGKIYIRIFDAELSGNHDRWEPESEVLYHLYGKGAIAREVMDIRDSLPSDAPIARLVLHESRYYDDRWRTIASPDVSEGEETEYGYLFQFIADGVKGKAVNKYQIFVSSLEKENKAVEGLRLTSPAIMLYLPPSAGMATQIAFQVPEDAEFLNISNFDADIDRYAVNMSFETAYSKEKSVIPSKDGQLSVTKIPVGKELRGQKAALVIRNKNQANHVRLWISDDKDRSVPLLLPVFSAAENRLPVPDIRVIPLSRCYSVMLDASASEDPDMDEMDFEWFFADGTRKRGSRIVHDFEKSGAYDIRLEVRDKSGFIANSSRLTRTLRINEPPLAKIAAPEKGVPGQELEFDASGSSDSDGNIKEYFWNFGDGSRAEGVKVKYRYPRAGKFRVRLTVEDDNESLCSRGEDSLWIRINTPPVPRLNIRETGAVGESIAMDARGSVDSDGEIIRYEWDFGDGQQGEGKEIQHEWKEPGEYTVRLKITDDADLPNSSTEEESRIRINAPPVAQAESKKVAAAGEEVIFDGSGSRDPDGQIRRYAWEMGDGTQTEGEKIRHAYEKPGVYDIRLTVTDHSDNLNDTDSFTFSIRINHPPVPAAGEDRIVNSSEVAFDAGNSSDADDPIIEYLWDFGDGIQEKGKTLSHIYALPGTYTVTLTVTDASGTLTATQSDRAVIRVNHPPVADAGADRVLSVGDSTVLDGGFSRDPDGEISAWQWESGDGTVLQGEKAEKKFEKPGIYQMRLSVRDNDGAENSDSALITVNAPPVADFQPVPRVAPGDKVIFDSRPSYDPDGRIAGVRWEFGDGSPDSEKALTEHVFEKPGRYAVTLHVQDDSPASANSASLTRTVEVNYPPRADAGKDIRRCEQTLQFDASGSADPDGDFLLYRWEFGDGSSGKGGRVIHHYPRPGIYPVNLTVDDDRGLHNSLAAASIVVHINAPPVPLIHINSQKVCAGEMVLFDAGKSADPEKGLLRYIWDLGDGKEVEGVNPVRLYKKGGDYRIRLKVTDDSGLPCSTAEAETILHVSDAPIAEAGGDMTGCANTPLQFDGSASSGGGRRIKSYEWDFGDGSFGVGSRPAHVYAKAGEYTARLIITVGGEGQCENISEDEIMVKVMGAPVAIIQGKTAVCTGEGLHLDGSASRPSEDASLISYHWDFGDGNTAEGAKTDYVFERSGKYEVKLTVGTDSAECCKTAEYTEIITVNAAPLPLIRVSSGGKEAVSGEEYETAPHTVLRFSAGKSHDPDGFITGYEWDFGDGQKESGPFVSHSYEKPGEYPVILRVQDNSGTSCSIRTARLLLKVLPLEQPPVQGPETVCAGESSEYAVAADSDTVPEWFFGDGTKSSGVQVTKTYKKPGKYQILVRRGDIWGPAKEVRVMALPEIRLPEKAEVFAGDPVKIQPLYTKNGNPPMIFHWESGDGNVRETENYDYVYPQPGEYRLQLSISGKEGPQCLKQILSLPVIVNPVPEAEIRHSPEQVFSGGARDEVLFRALLKNGGNHWLYHWDFGDGKTAPGDEVAYIFKKPGKYTVSVILSDPLHRTGQKFRFSEEITVKGRK